MIAAALNTPQIDGADVLVGHDELVVAEQLIRQLALAFERLQRPGMVLACVSREELSCSASNCGTRARARGTDIGYAKHSDELGQVLHVGSLCAIRDGAVQMHAKHAWQVQPAVSEPENAAGKNDRTTGLPLKSGWDQSIIPYMHPSNNRTGKRHRLEVGADQRECGRHVANIHARGAAVHRQCQTNIHPSDNQHMIAAATKNLTD